MRRSFFFPFFCIFSICAFLLPAANADVGFNNFLKSETLGQTVEYTLYLPPGYAEDHRSYPVLYLLHGGGSGQPSDWFTLAGIDQLLDQMIEDGSIRPMIAIAPDGRRDHANEVATYFLDDASGDLNWQTMFFQEFMPTIEKRHRAISDGENRAILGISMGAFAATVYQFQNADSFAGIAALSPAFRTEEQLLELSEGAYHSRYAGVLGQNLKAEGRLTHRWKTLQPSFMAEGTALSRFRRIPRLYFDTGSDDPFFEATSHLHVVLKKAGISHRFLVREGGHNWRYWRDSLKSAILHIDAIFTRGYGE